MRRASSGFVSRALLWTAAPKSTGHWRSLESRSVLRIDILCKQNAIDHFQQSRYPLSRNAKILRRGVEVMFRHSASEPSERSVISYTLYVIVGLRLRARIKQSRQHVEGVCATARGNCREST